MLESLRERNLQGDGQVLFTGFPPVLPHMLQPLPQIRLRLLCQALLSSGVPSAANRTGQHRCQPGADDRCSPAATVAFKPRRQAVSPSHRPPDPLGFADPAWRGQQVPDRPVRGIAAGAYLLRRGELDRIGRLAAPDRIQLRVGGLGTVPVTAPPPVINHPRCLAEAVNQPELALRGCPFSCATPP
jgi:hypothetical protein